MSYPRLGCIKYANNSIRKSVMSEHDEPFFYPLGQRQRVTKGLYNIQIYPNKNFQSFNSFTGLAVPKTTKSGTFKILTFDLMNRIMLCCTCVSFVLISLTSVTLSFFRHKYAQLYVLYGLTGIKLYHHSLILHEEHKGRICNKDRIRIVLCMNLLMLNLDLFLFLSLFVQMSIIRKSNRGETNRKFSSELLPL